MTLPPGYRPREGDIVVLHATVKHDVDDGEKKVFLSGIEGRHGTTYCDVSAIVALRSRHWNKGERVRNVNDNDDVGTVIACEDARVWVRTDAGADVIFDGAMLEALPPIVVEPEADQPAGTETLLRHSPDSPFLKAAMGLPGGDLKVSLEVGKGDDAPAVNTSIVEPPRRTFAVQGDPGLPLPHPKEF